MATFEQRDSGWWQAKVRRGAIQQSKTFEKKVDAEKWARDIENQIDRGIFVPREEAEKTSLAEALERYLREVTPGKKGAYQESYLVKAWLKDPLASRMLAALRSSDFAAWRDARLAEGLSQQTVRHKLNLISGVFTTAAQEWGIPVANPIANIRKPAVARARDRRLTGDEEKCLLDAIASAGAKDKEGNDRSNPWIGPVVRFALETGMRQGEILGLEWRHVDLKRCTAHLPETKNGTARTVPLSSTALAVLGAIPRPIKGGKVFPTSESAFKQAWQKAVRRARKAYEKERLAAGANEKAIQEDPLLQDLHFHDLRHEATSRLFEKGLDVMEVASITGHKTLQMLKRYTHLKAENLARKLR